MITPPTPPTPPIPPTPPPPTNPSHPTHPIHPTFSKGRFIVALDPTQSSYTAAMLIKRLREALPSAPVPRMILPLWVVRILVATGFHKALDVAMYVRGKGKKYTHFKY